LNIYMRSWKTIGLLLLISGTLIGQTRYGQLRAWHQESLMANNGDEKNKAFADSLWFGIQELVEIGMGISVDSLPSISQVELKGENKVLLSWLTRNHAAFQSWGLIFDKKTMKIWDFHPNEAASLSDPSILKKMLSGGKWPGMLVYEAVAFKRKNQTLFLLIGFFPGSDNLNYKHIDVMSFDKAGSPIFGSRHISWEGQKIGRKTFRYSAQASMMLKSEKGEKRLVMDHLAPASPELKNQFAFYGPDLSYDALEFNGEEWIMIPEVDLKNPGQDQGKPGKIQRFGPNIQPRRDSSAENK